MKKLILLSAAGLLCYAADAQQSRVSVARISDASASQKAQKQAVVFGGDRITESRFKNNGKTTAAAFYSETFGSGTATTLPTGWSAAAGTGFTKTWRWTNIASPAPYNIGVLNSTSKADGWMIYDSDSIGNTNPTATPVTGSLTSPSIPCTGHTSVLLTFEENFRAFQDSCYVDVSVNGGSSWTTFPVVENNALTANSSVTNPHTARVNITSVAANQANVTLRFRYVGNYAGGSYNWLIDDVHLSELDPVELGIANSGMFLYLGPPAPFRSYSLFSNYPVQLVDSLLPVTYLSNYGLNPQTNVSVNAKLFNGSTNVYDYNQTLTSFPYQKIDSIVDWGDVATMYKPTAMGSYTGAFSVNQSGDAVASNNLDSVRFNVTDTMLTTYGPVGSGSAYYIHRNIAQGGEMSLYQGVRFDIPAGKTDTVTSISVSYDSRTSTGVNTVVQLYKMISNGSGIDWDPVISTRQKTLTSGDISSSTARVWAVYPATTAGGPYILTAGTYAAVVTAINAKSTDLVLIAANGPMNAKTDISAFFGQSDTSLNSANFDFASGGGIATGFTNVPLVRINFGNKWKLGVNSLQSVTIGDAFPNPANNTVSVPVSATSGASVSVSLSNLMGQVLQTQTLGNIGAGQRKTAVFNTTDLAAGIYLYTVESNGERVSNRIVVAH